MDANGHALGWGVSVRQIVNKTKLQIIAVMAELDQPVSAAELYALWDGSKRLAVFDYHLCTLVRAGVVKVVSGPELRFRLTDAVGVLASQRFFRERCR